MRSEISLVSDPAYPTYNLGNFYHYSFGYLFPAIAYLQKQEPVISHLKVYENYLKQYAQDFLKLFCLKTSIVFKSNSETNSVPGDVETLPRWDYQLLALSSLKYQHEFYQRYFSDFQTKFPNVTLFNELAANPDSVEFPLKEHLLTIRSLVLTSIDSVFNNPYHNKILLIDRAPVSNDIHRSDFFKWRGYGKHSRTIMNMDVIEEALLAKGINVVRFNPGVEPIATQISAFASCSGVISLRGAELLHTLWMPNDAKMIVIETRDLLPGCNYSRVISDWLHHDYHDIEVRQGRYVTIDPEVILNCF